MAEPPFGLRDYLAYGMTGLIVVGSAASAVQGRIDMDPELSGAQVALVLLGSYVVGHVVAELTAPAIGWLLERRSGDIVTTLLTPRPGLSRVKRRYAGPLSAPTRAAVTRAAAECGLTVAEAPDDATVSALRTLAGSVVREVHETPDRADRYGLLEDFCRNVAAAASFAAVAFAIGAAVHLDAGLAAAAGAALALASVMSLRYLHFRRLYWVVLLGAFTAHVLGYGEREPAAPPTRRSARRG